MKSHRNPLSKRFVSILSSIVIAVTLFSGLPSYDAKAASWNDQSYWAQFESRYYYDQMNENQKTLYRNLYNLLMGYLTGTESLSPQQYQITENGRTVTKTGYFTNYAYFSGLNENSLFDAVLTCINSNPQFYFVAGDVYQYSISGGMIAVRVYDDFANGASRQNATATVMSKVDAWLSDIRAEATDYARAKKAHDILSGSLNYSENRSRYNQSSAGAILENYSVCAGYSEGYEMLLRGAGIPAVIVTSQNHEWNEVQIGGNWYNVDLTWNDSMSTDRFFLVDDGTLRANDTGANRGAHTPEAIWSRLSRPAVNGSFNGSAYKMVSGTSSYMSVDFSETPSAGAADGGLMYRLYNRNSGEHFYTLNAGERSSLIAAGWSDEGTAWNAAPAALSATPVYRMYNPNAGEHFYTTSSAEAQSLINVGWNYEGKGWFSNDAASVPVYRVYNPNARANNHHYTTDASERDMLVSKGWRDEGIAWFGM